MLQGKKNVGVLTGFFDNGVYAPLFAATERSVTAANGLVGGRPVYAVCQSGDALSAADIDVMTRALHLAAKTGNPVVTFYNAPGAKLEEGLGILSATASLNAAIAKISGVVPQIAVVLGICGASAALSAAAADLCIMSADAELFLAAPFLSAAKGDKTPGAGSAAFAAKAGVAALVADNTESAVRKAAELIVRLPANNLALPSEFDFTLPSAALNLSGYTAQAAMEAIADTGSVYPLYTGYGTGLEVAFATVGGGVIGFVATAGPDVPLCRQSADKAARFVRLCDAFSIPLVTLLHTDGFSTGSAEDMAGGIRAAARLAATYADATTARVAVLAGKAVGPAYIALGCADLTIALPGSTVLAPAEPSAVVSVLYKEELGSAGDSLAAATAAKVKEYEAASGEAALAAGLADIETTPAGLRAAVESALGVLASKRVQRLPKKHGNMSL